MVALRLLIVIGSLLILDPRISGAEVVYLNSGDSLEGTILDESGDFIALRLSSGVTVQIDRKDVKSVETTHEIVDVPGLSELPDENLEIELRPLFEVENPTPTPLPLELFPDFQVRKKFRPSRLKEGLFAKPGESVTEEEAKPEGPKKVDRTYGQVTWSDPGSKFRRPRASWEPILAGITHRWGDEINTDEGRLEMITLEGDVIRIHPATRLRLFPRGLVLDEGKIWVQSVRENPFTVQIDGKRILVDGGVFMVETLKTGYKYVLLAGNSRIESHPEGNILEKNVPLYSTTWFDREGAMTVDPNVDESTPKEWEKWQAEMAEKRESPDPKKMFEGLLTDSESSDLKEKKLEQKARLGDIAQAVSEFYLDLGRFPEEKRPFFNDLIVNPGSPDWMGPYLENEELPLLDEWGTEILYRIQTDPVSAEVRAEVYSLGPDKRFQEGQGDDLGILIARPGVEPSAPALQTTP